MKPTGKSAIKKTNESRGNEISHRPRSRQPDATSRPSESSVVGATAARWAAEPSDWGPRASGRPEHSRRSSAAAFRWRRARNAQSFWSWTKCRVSKRWLTENGSSTTWVVTSSTRPFNATKRVFNRRYNGTISCLKVRFVLFCYGFLFFHFWKFQIFRLGSLTYKRNKWILVKGCRGLDQSSNKMVGQENTACFTEGRTLSIWWQVLEKYKLWILHLNSADVIFMTTFGFFSVTWEKIDSFSWKICFNKEISSLKRSLKKKANLACSSTNNLSLWKSVHALKLFLPYYRLCFFI